MRAILNITLFLLLMTTTSFAATEAGPRGGKFLNNGDPQAEVMIEENGKVSIAFYDKAKKQVDSGNHLVTAIAEAPQGKLNLEFEKMENLLVSKTSLPAGENYIIVFQVKQTADAKPQNFRIKYNLHICGGCNLAEYACTCDH